MIISEVEETITTVEIDEETFEELFKVSSICYLWQQPSPSTIAHYLPLYHPQGIPAGFEVADKFNFVHGKEFALKCLPLFSICYELMEAKIAAD